MSVHLVVRVAADLAGADEDDEVLRAGTIEVRHRHGQLPDGPARLALQPGQADLAFLAEGAKPAVEMVPDTMDNGDRIMGTVTYFDTPGAVHPLSFCDAKPGASDMIGGTTRDSEEK